MVPDYPKLQYPTRNQLSDNFVARLLGLYSFWFSGMSDTARKLEIVLILAGCHHVAQYFVFSCGVLAPMCNSWPSKYDTLDDINQRRSRVGS